ncbi:MAG: rhomboid family intramembrane serine protease [Thermodesulfovibrionales bacterium]|nr:rhomboid family intramembrane serine protease [Thermodesulfovibrionales bacterium]MDP3112314.1 rhomboid family intramembrane serine protease [Thermodesulfovibrionales bacterium]
MIPFKDDNPTSIFPFVTIGIIAINILVYIWEIMSPAGEQFIVYKYGAIPLGLLSFERAQPLQLHPALTIFSSMFLHGGLLHIGGNMLYLWIFGNNIEDMLGHFRFFMFYLISGIVAAYSHAIMASSSSVPMIGASGAVAGVLGAYLLLFPRARVHTLIFLVFFVEVIKIPALIVIGFWAIIQVVNGLLTQGIAAQGGVAWFAHIGGFLVGLLTIKLWLPKRRFRE